MLQLTDTKPGTLQPILEWSNGKKVEVAPKPKFLDRFTDKKYDWKTEQTAQSTFYYADNLPKEAEAFHKNYMEYLERCWGDHLGVVFTPDILWYTILSELVLIVQKDPEAYRHLFSKSDEKQTLLVNCDGGIMPLSLLVDLLKEKVPTDSGLFMPKFTTTHLRGKHAMRAVFCDMCSPYYNYMMLLCDFPAIDVRGQQSDYEKIASHWEQLTELFPAVSEYMNRVGKVIDRIIENLTKVNYWRGMFRLENCGSGHQVKVRGWWTDLYLEVPRTAYPENFSTHVAKVPYTSLNFDPPKDFEMQDGLFYSKMNGDFLEPQFGFIINEKKKEPVVIDG